MTTITLAGEEAHFNCGGAGVYLEKQIHEKNNSGL